MSMKISSWISSMKMRTISKMEINLTRIKYENNSAFLPNFIKERPISNRSVSLIPSSLIQIVSRYSINKLSAVKNRVGVGN